MNQWKLNLDDIDFTYQELAGVSNKNLNYIEEVFEVDIKVKENELLFKSNQDIEKLKEFMFLLNKSYQKERTWHLEDLEYFYWLVKEGKSQRFLETKDTVLTRTFSGKAIKAKTIGQGQLIDALSSHDLTFAIGPAGTGKTFLAVAYAVEKLKNKEVSKIILTRPAVEAGENLGFLPGDLKEKVDPYLRPLYDALDELLSPERVERYIEKGVIEIAPLAYMRGRTLDHAVVILDEAQNTTPSQMLMFLSRLGRHSKMVVNGDLQQIDLNFRQESGLKKAEDYLQGISEIAFVHLSEKDVVRHPLVVKILERFEKGVELDEKKSSSR